MCICQASGSVFRIPHVGPYLHPCNFSAMPGPETESPSEMGAAPTPAKKNNRGKDMIADKRAAQSSDDTEVREAENWTVAWK